MFVLSTPFGVCLQIDVNEVFAAVFLFSGGSRASLEAKVGRIFSADGVADRLQTESIYSIMFHAHGALVRRMNTRGHPVYIRPEGVTISSPSPDNFFLRTRRMPSLAHVRSCLTTTPAQIHTRIVQQDQLRKSKECKRTLSFSVSFHGYSRITQCTSIVEHHAFHVTNTLSRVIISPR